MTFAVEKAFDIVLDALIEKSKDEIDDILQKSKRKKMLQKTLECFTEHALANAEYSNLVYVNCPETIASLSEEALDPSQDIEALRDYLLPVVRQSFVTDEDIDWNQLTLILAQYYKQRAQITIQIYEISNQLQRTESRVLKEIGEIQTIIKADEESKKRADAQKELYYRTFVQRKVNSLIRTVVQDVYSFIFKQLIQPMANQDSTIVAFEELKKFKDALNKNADVHFMKKPILRITIDPNGSDEPRKIQIMPADFINGVLLPHARNQIQLVLQHKDVLSLEVYYAVLMLEQRLESNAFLQAVSRGAGKMMESLSFRQEDVAMIFNSLATMALDLKPFYREGQ